MAELHEYPYTHYTDDLNCFMGMCKKAGVKLAVVGDSLQLLDKCNFVLSQVKIQVAQSALKDSQGRDITSYLVSAGTRGDYLVFLTGEGNETVIEVPASIKATKDSLNQNITSYIKNVQTDGNELKITFGDGTSYNIVVPFSSKSFATIDNIPLTTLAAALEVSGDNLILKDSRDNIISTVRVSWAEKAKNDEAGNDIRDSYASKLQAGTTTIKLFSKSNELLSEIVCPFSQVSHQDENGNAFLHDYAETLTIDSDGKKLDLLAHDGTLLSAVRVPWSDLSEHANKAIETVQIVGNEVVFTTYEGSVTRVQVPWALKAGADKDNNLIDESYIADVRQDAVTGVISFYAMNGDVLATLTPQSRVAEYDTYSNLIGDFVKTLVFDNQSKYLIATHGTGQSDEIRIEYATSAWKDDLSPNGNIIKNVYHKKLLIEEDNEGRFCLIGLNGENSEITRLILPELTAAVGSGLVINQHTISLTNEVKERIYDFDYVSDDERLDISTHILTT